MRKRTRPKVVWLPLDIGQAVQGSTFQLVTTAVTAAGPGTVLEVPVVLDGKDPLSANSSLADIESSGYRLRRIVGKIWVFLGQSNGIQEDSYGVSVGLMVRRVDPTTGLSLASTLSQSQVDPVDPENIMDPWIWRRSWILSNGPTFAGFATPLATDEAAAIVHRGPSSNQLHGSALDGPHIDQKTARIVGPEERLFLDASVTPLVASGNDTTLLVVYELRVLGSMRANVGNRRNASR